jgi:hypothetical protein
MSVSSPPIMIHCPKWKTLPIRVREAISTCITMQTRWPETEKNPHAGRNGHH